MGTRLDRASSLALPLAAIAIAFSIVWRTFFAPGDLPAFGTARAAPQLRTANWDELVRSGVRVHGDTAAEVTMVVFTDFECSACAMLHATLTELLPTYHDDLQVVLVHFPLTRHQFAMPAARAFECADEQGLGQQWMNTVFDLQDSLRWLDWGELALRAGIADTGSLAKCARDTSRVERIARGIELGRQLEIPGTPTVFMNRWTIGMPTKEAIESRIISMRAAASR